MRAISAAGPFSALISLYLQAAETHCVQTDITREWQEPWAWDAAINMAGSAGTILTLSVLLHYRSQPSS